MSTLSSCYFCGTALDAPITSYPVVPEGIPTDTDHTVSLCPTCQRKRHGLLEIVLEAIDDAESVDTTLDEYEERAEQTTAVETPASPTSDEDSEPKSSDDEGMSASEGETAKPDETAQADEERDAADAHSDSDEESQTDERATPATEPDESDETGSDGDATGEEAASADAESPEEDTAETATDEANEEAESSGEKPSVLSTPAAKKVIRLLQNREFPVDRAEFGDLASSAYDIPPQDCEEVLDALVEEGYVGEKRGKLVREE